MRKRTSPVKHRGLVLALHPHDHLHRRDSLPVSKDPQRALRDIHLDVLVLLPGTRHPAEAIQVDFEGVDAVEGGVIELLESLRADVSVRGDPVAELEGLQGIAGELFENVLLVFHRGGGREIPLRLEPRFEEAEIRIGYPGTDGTSRIGKRFPPPETLDLLVALQRLDHVADTGNPGAGPWREGNRQTATRSAGAAPVRGTGPRSGRAAGHFPLGMHLGGIHKSVGEGLDRKKGEMGGTDIAGCGGRTRIEQAPVAIAQN